MSNLKQEPRRPGKDETIKHLERLNARTGETKSRLRRRAQGREFSG